MKILLITQARMGSTRLPGKVLKEINGVPLLKIHLDRIKKCKNVSEIVVATTQSEEDTKIVELVNKWGFESFQGSEEDVLDRFYQVARLYQPDWVVRVTSDCPLLDSELVDKIIDFAIQEPADYVSNTIINDYPDGQDVEVFTFQSLKKAWEHAEKLSEREHVTPYIRNNSNISNGTEFKVSNFPASGEYGNIRMTVDEVEDFRLLNKIITELGTDKTWKEYADYIIENNLNVANDQYKRNEGYLKSLEKDKQ